MRHRRVQSVLLAGIGYFVIGRVFTWPASNVHTWRLAAWGVSAVLCGVHAWYEYFRAEYSSRSTARDVAAGVAVGAFLLALAAMLHAVTSGPGMRATWLLALVAWPALTAVPAWCVTAVALALCDRFGPRTRLPRI